MSEDRCPGPERRVVRRGTSGLRAAAAAAASVALVTLVSPSSAGQPLSLDYHVYAGGFHAVSFSTEFNIGEDSYRARVNLRSNGLIDRLFSFSMEANADGRSGENGVVPLFFRTSNRWRSSGERFVEISYDEPGDVPRTVVQPVPDADEREPVPDELRRNTLDPLSAIVQLIRGLSNSGRCDSKAAVFDGRRRYDLAARHLGEIVLKPSDVAPYGGPAVKCAIEVQRVVGRWKKSKRWREAGPPTIHVFLARLDQSSPLVPVRIEAKNNIGQVRVHLVGSGGVSLAER